jgi:hypothetical protein
MLRIGQLECVLYDVVCGLFFCVDIEKAMVSVDDHQERELHIGLCRLVVKMRLGCFQNVTINNKCAPI